MRLSTSVGVSRGTSGVVANAEKLFANEALYQLSYTPVLVEVPTMESNLSQASPFRPHGNAAPIRFALESARTFPAQSRCMFV